MERDRLGRQKKKKIGLFLLLALFSSVCIREIEPENECVRTRQQTTAPFIARSFYRSIFSRLLQFCRELRRLFKNKKSDEKWRRVYSRIGIRKQWIDKRSWFSFLLFRSIEIDFPDLNETRDGLFFLLSAGNSIFSIFVGKNNKWRNKMKIRCGEQNQKITSSTSAIGFRVCVCLNPMRAIPCSRWESCQRRNCFLF